MNTDKSFKSSHLKSKSQVFNFQIQVKLRVFSGPSLDDSTPHLSQELDESSLVKET